MSIKILIMFSIVAILSLANADTTYFDQNGKQITKEEYDNIHKTNQKKITQPQIPSPSKPPNQANTLTPNTYSVPSMTPASKYKAPEPETKIKKPCTSDKCVACFSKTHIENMTKFSVSNDHDSIDAYIKYKYCYVLKENLPVTVLEYPGMLGGYVQFVYKGITFWTTSKGINF